MAAQDNFLTNELYQYCLGQASKLSEETINILNKSASELTEMKR